MDVVEFADQGSDVTGIDTLGEGQTVDTSPHEDEPHIGAYLAAQRRLRGISREELCHMTRIPLRSLARLEEGAFDQQEDGFVRGFVRTVALALGLDPHDTLARMSSEPLAWDTGPSFGQSGLIRSLLLFLALAGLLGSVGLVSLALRPGPGAQETPLVRRRDPVRALAEDLGGRSALGVELVPMMSMRRTEEVAAATSPAAEVEPIEAPTRRAPHLEAATTAP